MSERHRKVTDKGGTEKGENKQGQVDVQLRLLGEILKDDPGDEESKRLRDKILSSGKPMCPQNLAEHIARAKHAKEAS